MTLINYYLKMWHLSDHQLLAQTVTSDVYTVDLNGTRVVLKLLTPLGNEEKEGAVALRYFDGHGAVHLLHEDDHAHLLEYADGEDLTGMVKNGQDGQAAAIIADVLNRLHNVSAPIPSQGLTPLPIWFRELFKKGASDNHDSIYKRAASLAEKLLVHPRDVRVLHGDIHHQNIRYQAQRGWLAFDPKGLVGERTFDAANTLCNPIDMPNLVHDEARLLKISQILARKMDIELPRLLDFVFVYSCLSASWSISDNADPSHALRVRKSSSRYCDVPAMTHNIRPVFRSSIIVSSLSKPFSDRKHFKVAASASVFSATNG
jgi:streptomycin 6-kinase